MVAPAHGINELPRLTALRQARLEAVGIEQIRHIPEEFRLTRMQRIVRRTLRDNQGVVHGDITGALAGITPPVRHLDFEAFSPAIHRFAGTRSYQQILFLLSVHAGYDGALPEHADYLHEGDDDPRPALADRLIAAAGRDGTTCSGYECRVLCDLAAALPDRASALHAIRKRLFDLHPVVRDYCYHPDFRGSFSIRKVLPVLVLGAGYGDPAVADGQPAAVRYSQAPANDDHVARRQAFSDLCAYCPHDTSGLVAVRGALALLSAQSYPGSP